MPLASGTRLGSYEIHAPIGAGGMGEVYRATDTRLGREVAVKILPAAMEQNPDRLARFHREARAVAALNHPNVVTLYSVEECDGVHFLTMELVDGISLDLHIPESGMTADQIVEIAGALAEGLAAAHEKGILHRDLKPANVMLTKEGRVKILDFGLAKEVDTDTHQDATLTSANHTQVGVVMGTPAYMSPEQISGRPLDHRTDIFSLGIMLHEMATGRRPFAGTSSAELASAILRDTPPSVTESRPDLPGDLARVIRRCLEKEPRHRVQTARDISNEFRDLQRASQARPVSNSAAAPRSAAPPDSGSARAEEGFWVAVLPFKHKGTDPGLEALADGLTEEIITGLSRFSYLRVIARGSTAKYSSESGDMRAIGKELGARYVMEGSLRQAGPRLRLAAQLVDATTGTHLWAETYERVFTPESVFEVQDDLVPRIVSTVADQYGVLPRSMSDVLRNKSEDSVTPHEAVLRAFSYFMRITPEEHGAVRRILERAVREAPDHADSWAMLSMMYRGEFAQGFNAGPNPLDRALAAAQHAVDLAPTHALGHYMLATVYFFRKEMIPFQVEAERALALNPLDAGARAYLGLLTATSGDWERGCQMVESAVQLNPNCPGYFYFAGACNAYRQGRYEEVLEAAARINMPNYYQVPALRAAALGQLGRLEDAHKAVQDLLALRPDFATDVRREYSKWYNSELIENIIDGLRRAGLEIPEAGAIAGQKSSTPPAVATLRAGAVHDSGATRADEGFWVAVLPFKYAGMSVELKAFADGLSEEIVTGLSRFSYLRVIARGSTAKYSSESGDVRAIGKELGARYVMEGSIRQAGNKLRLAVQLVDAVSGAHLWAENYERTFSPEAVFELQDDLVPRIVSTIADTHGVLPYSMNQTLRNRHPDELTPYEALLRGFAYFKHVNPADHDGARAALEKAVKQVPGNADCWAMLSMLYREEYNHGFNVRPDPVGRALSAARRAVDTAPSNHLAHHALASVLFFRHESAAFRSAAERAIELNPMDGFTIGYMGFLLSYSGDWDRGCALMERARGLNPNHPGWYWFPPFFNAYRKGDYRAALEFALKVNMPGFWRNELVLAVTYGQLGELELARNAARELLTARPGFDTVAREECAKWWGPELVEQIMDGLRKAGLEIAGQKAASFEQLRAKS
jgi:TolB-like protein